MKLPGTNLKLIDTAEASIKLDFKWKQAPHLMHRAATWTSGEMKYCSCCIEEE